MNYKAVIKQNAWLVDAKGRTWLVRSLRYAWDFNAKDWKLSPYIVELLELFATETIERPFDEIVQMFEKGYIKERPIE